MSFELDTKDFERLALAPADVALRLKGIELFGEADRRINLQKFRRGVKGGSCRNGRRDGKVRVQATIYIIEKIA